MNLTDTSAPSSTPNADARVASFAAAPPLDRLSARAADGELLVCIDQPTATLDGAEQFVAPLKVDGWAYSRHDVVEVWVVVDGTTWVQALHRQWRPDLVAPLEQAEARHCGFGTVLSAAECPPGRREITVIAVDGQGYAAGTTLAVEIAADRNVGGPGATADPALPVPRVPLDGNGERYVPELHEGTSTAAEHQARYRWASALAEGRAVLDAGCGVGWGTALLLEADAASVVGLDLSEVALDSARERTAGRATLVRGDLQAQPFDDDSFDLVVCFEAIEHVEDPERALDELRRVLRPDGVLLISSPNRGVYPTGNPHHLHEYASAELEATLRARFAVVTAYRQQTHVGSLLTTDADFATADAGTVLDAELRKTVGGVPGEELYTVVAASDAPLRPLAPIAVLTDVADVKGWHETTLALERRALVAEAELSTSESSLGILRFENDKALHRLQAIERSRREAEERCTELERERDDALGQVAAAAESLVAEHDELRRQRDAAERWLADHRSSLSWRITAPLRAAKRARASRKGR